ncbi:PEP-CTERM/exosortase system-associated acyltransferase [Alteromonas sp. ASW11-19]|uniref:PEP-CTERM/exosortase system-associated acyltransferase n=1 Tax=Alteromonas salexigens TaxID=2982530 RepID=A0ABT2VLQ2_9ALTE|nr:PEP-CTERM/exosortase system-associated acyltransferase [Alteromonas salexigens]MCU7554247.1 PEP-CTERM/exosortase system-associated acyltransferase [Alteromonas salexigens]
MRPVIRRKVNKTVDAIASHFFEHFTLVVATDEASQRECYKTRHQVYCEEMGFEPVRQSGLETDEFDDYALSCYIKHKATGDCAGTIRLVMPVHPGQLLPLEQNCPQAIRFDEHSPQRYPRHSICEVSRLAIPKRFRRRQSDSKLSPVTGKHSKKNLVNQHASRSFPYLSMALYFFAASICLIRDVENVYVMMEPKLARSMRLLGISFQQLGNEVDYHGSRAAYQLSPAEFMQQISPALRRFQRKIMVELDGVPEFGHALSNYHNRTAQVKKQQQKRRRAA